MTSSLSNNFKPNGLATLIGSLPVATYSEALDWITTYTPEIPLWPQLPSNPLEGMMNQFIEGLPGIVESDGSTYFTLSADNFEEEQLAFFEEYISTVENPASTLTSRFTVSKERANGIYELKKLIQKNLTNPVAIKGQITGPFTLLAGITDQDKRLGYYEPAFREMAVKALAMKGAWQVEFLKELNLPTIIFIDEPALAGLGSSAFISIDKADISQDLNEVIDSIKGSGGIAGIHVCANTDWSFIFSLNLDVLSFDAHGFFDKLVTCLGQVHSFLDRGGIIAWGIVPTANAEIIAKESIDSLVTMWEVQAAQLVNDKWDLKSILGQTLITPSCGTGAIGAGPAKQVLELAHGVSQTLRSKYY
nr:hypothetical protein [Desulfobulbaceae bacterium]